MSQFRGVPVVQLSVLIMSACAHGGLVLMKNVNVAREPREGAVPRARRATLRDTASAGRGHRMKPAEKEQAFWAVLVGASLSLTVACCMAGGWRLGVVAGALLAGKAWGAWKTLPK